ncbi:MAG: hypothetical protein ACPGVB_09005 [Chitinophagales bacterium]
MNKPIFFLLLCLLSFAACKDEGTSIDADLHYDGENESAPFLDAGTWEAAARFPMSIMTEFQGRNLEEVEFFILERPDACAIHIYGEGNSDEAGTLLYSEDVSGSVNANSWNRHTLSAPLAINGDDLWISVVVTHNSPIASVGCDEGPAELDGDWTYSHDDGEWRSLNFRSNQQVNINWNIRGYVGE